MSSRDLCYLYVVRNLPEDNILYFWPQETPEDTKLNTVGLTVGLLNFFCRSFTEWTKSIRTDAYDDYFVRVGNVFICCRLRKLSTAANDSNDSRRSSASFDPTHDVRTQPERMRALKRLSMAVGFRRRAAAAAVEDDSSYVRFEGDKFLPHTEYMIRQLQLSVQLYRLFYGGNFLDPEALARFYDIFIYRFLLRGKQRQMAGSPDEGTGVIPTDSRIGLHSGLYVPPPKVPKKKKERQKTTSPSAEGAKEGSSSSDENAPPEGSAGSDGGPSDEDKHEDQDQKSEVSAPIAEVRRLIADADAAASRMAKTGSESPLSFLEVGAPLPPPQLLTEFLGCVPAVRFRHARAFVRIFRFMEHLAHRHKYVHRRLRSRGSLVNHNPHLVRLDDGEAAASSGSPPVTPPRESKSADDGRERLVLGCALFQDGRYLYSVGVPKQFLCPLVLYERYLWQNRSVDGAIVQEDGNSFAPMWFYDADEMSRMEKTWSDDEDEKLRRISVAEMADEPPAEEIVNDSETAGFCPETLSEGTKPTDVSEKCFLHVMDVDARLRLKLFFILKRPSVRLLQVQRRALALMVIKDRSFVPVVVSGPASSVRASGVASGSAEDPVIPASKSAFSPSATTARDLLLASGLRNGAGGTPSPAPLVSSGNLPLLQVSAEAAAASAGASPTVPVRIDYNQGLATCSQNYNSFFLLYVLSDFLQKRKKQRQVIFKLTRTMWIVCLKRSVGEEYSFIVLNEKNLSLGDVQHRVFDALRLRS